MKYCSRCAQDKPGTEFYKKSLPNGGYSLRSYCKSCGKAERDAWRKASPKDNERNKEYNRTHAEEIRGKKLVKNYWPSLTWQQAIAEWNRLFTLQDGLCAFGHASDTLHVDHCHTTGKVRGLLCYNCNSGIGRFKDNVEVMQKAIEYLNRSKT